MDLTGVGMRVQGIRCEAAVLLTDVTGCSPVVQEGQVQQAHRSGGWLVLGKDSPRFGSSLWQLLVPGMYWLMPS